MKFYRVWMDSAHNIRYTIGYFIKFEDAQKALKDLMRSGSAPPVGMEELWAQP